jgi:hypothetical protein
VVCVTGAFTLTPLFAHNQSAVLNQLLSPADAMPYNANINVDNVEVRSVPQEYVYAVTRYQQQQQQQQQQRTPSDSIVLSIVRTTVARKASC